MGPGCSRRFSLRCRSAAAPRFAACSARRWRGRWPELSREGSAQTTPLKTLTDGAQTYHHMPKVERKTRFTDSPVSDHAPSDQCALNRLEITQSLWLIKIYHELLNNF